VKAREGIAYKRGAAYAPSPARFVSRQPYLDTRGEKMEGEKIFVVLPLCVGSVFSLFGLCLALNTLQFVRSAVKTPGVVVGHAKHTIQGDDRTSTYYHAEIEFDDQGGKRRRVTLTQGNGSKSPVEGHRVWVLYDPSNPQDARLSRASDLWLFPLVFLAMGLLALAAGIWALCFGVPQGFTIGGPM